MTQMLSLLEDPVLASKVHTNLGITLEAQERLGEAVGHYRSACVNSRI